MKIILVKSFANIGTEKRIVPLEKSDSNKFYLSVRLCPSKILKLFFGKFKFPHIKEKEIACKDIIRRHEKVSCT